MTYNKMSFRISNSIDIAITGLAFGQAALNTRVDTIEANGELVPESISNKGINIDDTTVALTPSSSNPRQSTDTFPYTWLHSVGQKVQSIRTYHYDTNGAAWVAWAVKNNIKVVIGITLSNYTAELNSLASDYGASSIQSQYNANVLAIAIGNEETDVSTIQAGIAYAKTLTLPSGALYTSVLNADGNWLNSTYPPPSCTFTSNFLTLEPSLDVLCFNCYGGYFTYGQQQFITVANSTSWQSTTNGGSVLLNEFGAIRFAMSAATITKEFWVTETGWCSTTELSQNPSWSNTKNLATFYYNFLGFPLLVPFTPQTASSSVMPPNRIFYFSLRDVPGGEGGAGFGLFKSSSTLAPKF